MNNLKNFLGLENFIVKEIIEEEDKIIISGQLERKVHTCPHCNKNAREVKYMRDRLIRDLPMLSKNVYIKIRKQWYICKHCKKIFQEENNFVSKYQRMTKRLVKKILDMSAESNSFSSISRELNIPIMTIIRTFDHINYP